MKKNKIVVEVDAPMEDTNASMVLIERLLKLNKIKMDLSIAYDFDTGDCGNFFPKSKIHAYRIFINPSNCKTTADIDTQNWNEPFCPGYCADLTLFGVTIHEFCHLLQYRAFPTIIKAYRKEFPTERFYLNGYCNNEIRDELAEIMTLYIVNPYLLKLISEKHFEFCEKRFKSPVDCTIERCFFIFNGFPIPVKEHLKNHWKIVYNMNKKQFEKVTNGKA